METNENTRKSLELLKKGFSEELTTFIYENEKFTELMMELVSEFVEKNIPIIDEEVRYDLSLMMMESLHVKTYE